MGGPHLSYDIHFWWPSHRKDTDSLETDRLMGKLFKGLGAYRKRKTKL